MWSMAQTEIRAPHESAHAASPSALARYPDLVAAREAMLHLESHGIDGDDISLVGATAAGAEDIEDRRQSDAQLVVGAVLGGLVGMVAGALVAGVVLLAWPGQLAHPLWAFGLGTAWIAGAGAVLGGFVAVSRKTGFSESWPLTFEDVAPGPVWLAVYGDDQKAVAALGETEPIELRTGEAVAHAVHDGVL